MGRYDDLLATVQASGLASNLSPVRAGRIEQLMETYPGLPKDYIELLRDVGFGSFGDGGYSLFGGLVLPDEVFDPDTSKKFSGLLLFGTDFEGYNSAFDPGHGWAVVEIDSATMTLMPVPGSFEEHIRRKIGELIAEGNIGEGQLETS